MYAPITKPNTKEIVNLNTIKTQIEPTIHNQPSKPSIIPQKTITNNLNSKRQITINTPQTNQTKIDINSTNQSPSKTNIENSLLQQVTDKQTTTNPTTQNKPNNTKEQTHQQTIEPKPITPSNNHNSAITYQTI